MSLSPNMLTSDGDNYVISSLSGLEESATELARYHQSLGSDVADLSEALGVIKANWQNEAGQDIESILLALNNVINSMNQELLPAVSKYYTIINEIVIATKRNQSTTM